MTQITAEISAEAIDVYDAVAIRPALPTAANTTQTAPLLTPA